MSRGGESRPTTSSASASRRGFLCKSEKGGWRCFGSPRVERRRPSSAALVQPGAGRPRPVADRLSPGLSRLHVKGGQRREKREEGLFSSSSSPPYFHPFLARCLHRTSRTDSLKSAQFTTFFQFLRSHMYHIRGIEHRWILSQEVAEIEKFRDSWTFSWTPSSPMERQAAPRSRFEDFVTRGGESRPTTSSASARGRCFLWESERGDWRCLEVVGGVLTGRESNRQLSSAAAPGRCFLCKSERGVWR